MIRILLLLIGYCCGLLQTGYLYSKMNGIDIRSKGSGNSGATNTLRVMGKKAGLIVFAGDLLKALIPCLIVRFIFAKENPDAMLVYMMYTAFGVILGHNYPFYLHFKGGKGISSTSGFILAFDLRISAVCLACFALAVGVTKYVSVGSLLVVTLNFILGIVFWKAGWIAVGDAYAAEYVILLAVIMLQAFIRHRANIRRLLNGTENKLGVKK